MGSEVSFTNAIKAAVENDITSEALIQLADKDNNCKLSREELMDFLRNWADKKHMSLSHETENFAGHGFEFMDNYKGGSG